MQIFTIGLATDWPLDSDFNEVLEKSARRRGLTTYKVTPSNLKETIDLIRNNQLRFLFYYDRASDTSPEFLKMYAAMSETQVLYFVDLEKQKAAADKSVMHQKFIQQGIKVPDTIIVPDLHAQPTSQLIESDLDIIGRPFVIKPSLNTGSGDGVYLNGFTVADVEDKRYEYPQDKYLLQSKIYPKEHAQRRYWFRVFYVCGSVIITWWDNHTHRYQTVLPEDRAHIDMDRFNEIMHKIHDVCGLEFFSTELTVTEDNIIYAVDYVNEICDMRVQSKHYDGVPNDIVRIIAERIVNYIEKFI